MAEIEERRRDGEGAGIQGAEGRVGQVQAGESGADAERADEVGAEGVLAVEQKVAPANVRLGYGHTNAQHGVHMVIEKRVYENPEVQDLERRVREAFKKQGFEF